MYSVMVPIHPKEYTKKEDVLSVLREARARYAVLAFDDVILSATREGYERTLGMVRELVPYLKENGYEVGIYFWSLWLGDLDREVLSREVMIGGDGKERIAESALNSSERRLSGFLCPTSERISVMLDIIRFAASLAPDLILLNDDLGYDTYLGGIGCYCERHLDRLAQRIGRKMTRDEVRDASLSGKRNPVRDAWLAVQGESIETYARQIREAIDEVNPEIRCGFCCVMSNWSADGTDVVRVARLMAGGTRPLLRLIGAPYWASGQAWGNRLQHVVELERMECAFVGEGDVELIAEGDVYPRPRYRVPASLLEHYDTALRAAGCTDGIFKLMLDYTSSFSYERGYLDRHIRHLPLYEQIERTFGDKACVGVRVYEAQNKAADADFTGIENKEKYAQDMFFSYGARFLSDNSVPTVYEGRGACIAFGENARHLSDEAIGDGLILDVRAAKILSERGVDVGVESFGEAHTSNLLLDAGSGERILSHYGNAAARKLTVKPTARVCTYAINRSEQYPDAFEYENADGQRFLVYAFDAAFVDENRYRNYLTQGQLVRSLSWLGAALPAVCLGNPDLYVLCKQNDEGLAIGLWNMFADEIHEPRIDLRDAFHDAEFIRCDGVLEGKVLRLSTIPAYGFAFVHLKK